MTTPPEPTQSEVLRERFSRVPWRRAFGDAIRGLAGRGPMAVPDRLEGAVLGQLSAGSYAGIDQAPLLELLDALLSGDAHPESAWPPSADLALAPALVLRDVPDSDLAASAASIAQGASDVPAVTASATLYALVVRRFIDGERNRRTVRAQARRASTQHASRAVRTVVEESAPEVFDSAWHAFDGARDPDGALSRAAGIETANPSGASAVAITGGLAGAWWGSSNIRHTRLLDLSVAARARQVVDRLVGTVPSGDGRSWQTSTSSPLTVHGVDASGVEPTVAGRIGISPLPGRRYVAYHTGAHWRDLDADARHLRQQGIDLLFLLVEDRELARCRVTDISEVLGEHGIDLVRHPIRDPLVPRDPAAFRASVAGVLREARRGRGVAVACRGGFDRAGMTAACLLREAGLEAAAAIDRVQRARPGALTLPDQQAYVRAWVHET